MKKHMFTICFVSALVAFTLYITLDTFVIRTTYAANAVDMNTDMFESEESGSDTEASAAKESYDKDRRHSGEEHSRPSDKQPPSDFPGKFRPEGNAWSGDLTPPDSGHHEESTDSESVKEKSPEQTAETSYQDDNISISLTEYNEYNTKIYVADIRLSSAQYLKTAFADDSYGRNITATTSEIAESKDAILAINGDYYGAKKSGYVIRNGIVYRDSANGSDILCIYADGTMEIVNDGDYSAQELVDKNVWQAFSFGPALVEDSSIVVNTGDEIDRELKSNPRTAIGLIDTDHFVFIVSDGRTSESAGLSLYELAEFMKGLGVKTAYNLDGGGSSTMYFNGQIINNPTTGGNRIEERKVSDIVYIR